MTAGPSIDPARFLTEQLEQASPDLMRDLLTTFVNALLGAQAVVPPESWRASLCGFPVEGR